MRLTASMILLVAYLSTGSVYARALQIIVPNVNKAGFVYVTLTWPLWLKASPIDPPVPTWAFSFKDDN